MGDGGGVLKREEGIGKVVKLVNDARVVSAWGENKVRAIMGKGRRDVKTTYAMLRPGWSIMRWEMGHNKLACGMDGVGGKIEGLSVDAVPGGENGVGAIGAQLVKGEFREREGMKSERTPRQQ
jgi:hypothetical protein